MGRSSPPLGAPAGRGGLPGRGGMLRGRRVAAQSPALSEFGGVRAHTESGTRRAGSCRGSSREAVGLGARRVKRPNGNAQVLLGARNPEGRPHPQGPHTGVYSPRGPGSSPAAS